MNQTLAACFITLSQAFAQCADAADVMPVWHNDTVVNTLTFDDTFGHHVSLGAYNPATGAWTPGGAQSIIVGTSIVSGTCPSGQVLTNNAGIVGCTALGAGTVTSVGMTVPSWLTVAPATITGAGTFAVTATSEPMNLVLASPSGGAGPMAPRALVAADISGIPGNLASGSSPISGTCTSGQVLYNNGGVMGCTNAGGSGTVTSVGLTLPSWLTVSPATITSAGTFAVTAVSEPQNLFLASPNGSTGAMAPRSITGNDLTSAMSSPPAIGGTMPAPGAFTTLSASGAVSGAGMDTYTAARIAAGLPAAFGTISAGTWNGTAIGIAFGGTGQVTAAAAFNALSPMTTAGDLIYGGASGAGTRLAAGTSSQFLMSGATPAWVSMSGDCTLAIGVITCTKTSGVAFGTFATQNFATPPSIGGTTPAPGAFTTASTTGLATLASASVTGQLTANNISSTELPHLSANVASSGQPGMDGSSGGVNWYLNNDPAAPGLLPTLRIDRLMTGTGGSNSNVTSALLVNVTASAVNSNFEWGISSIMNNASPNTLNSQNVAIAATALKQGASVQVAPTWALFGQCQDQTGVASPAAACIGAELDSGVPPATNGGADPNGVRVALQLVAVGASGTHVGKGLLMNTYNSGVVFDKGIVFDGSAGGSWGTAIDMGNMGATGNSTAILMQGAQQHNIAWKNAVGTYSSSTAGSQIMKAADNNNYFDNYDTGFFIFRGSAGLPAASTAVVGALRVYTTTANGSVATAMSSLGPTGSHTTVQEWFPIQNSAGVVRYVPGF